MFDRRRNDSAKWAREEATAHVLNKVNLCCIIWSLLPLLTSSPTLLLLYRLSPKLENRVQGRWRKERYCSIDWIRVKLFARGVEWRLVDERLHFNYEGDNPEGRELCDKLYKLQFTLMK